MEVVITKSINNKKKFDAIVDGKKISCGATGYSDYTIHKDPERKERYIARLKKNEEWDKSGVKTAGYWSTNLLWNKETLQKSIDDISKKHNLNIKMK